ncbi:MAG: hypothetical protein P4L72_02635 [Parvibaculum sp.]|uniref:hypothetical protein n=1 Tax=Parvibaculum sp. TaxID=2024848 RepID=UPI00283BBE88|nr:hypothetical protein [Parvibaculum sp.]MDR3498106.1 hypothetical protein [Parvibaculum sp.]
MTAAIKSSMRKVASYRVNRMAYSLPGWSPATLTLALRGPLGDLGVMVETWPDEVEGWGFRVFDKEAPIDWNALEEIVHRTVVKIVYDKAVEDVEWYRQQQQTKAQNGHVGQYGR